MAGPTPRDNLAAHGKEGANMTPEQDMWSEMICSLVAEGQSLQKIANLLGVSIGTVFNRATCTPEACERYARARTSSADVLEAEYLELCRGVTGATFKEDRVKIDGMKWILARRDSAKYGERARVDHTSSDGSMTPKTATGGVDLSKLPDDVLKALMDARTND